MDSAKLQIAEISGSESIIRVNVNDNSWVSEAHGVHSYEFSEKADFVFDARKCMYFGADHRLIEP